jgi:hypothetical protein
VSNIELKCVDEKAYQEHTINASVPILKHDQGDHNNCVLETHPALEGCVGAYGGQAADR